MPLNISAGESSESHSAIPSAVPEPAARRQQLVDELTDELTSWNPREFMFAFRRLHRGSISLIHLNVLTLLEAEGPMPMGRLADALDVSVASATGIVTRMEIRGLVERTRDDRDRRVVLVRRSEAGMAVFSGIDENRRAGLSRLLGHLTDGELAGFLTGHRALRLARATYIQSELAAGERTQTPGADLRPTPAKEAATR